jgi:flagella basal body P-ring formation protein FlgA
MHNNGRPLSARKKVQLLIALTILAWATQTLLHQWARGAEIFVGRSGAASGGTLELRGEAKVQGAEVKLRQVCRWSEDDATLFAPVADVVLAKLDTGRPYKKIDVRDVRQVLEEARINVAMVRFSGPLECTVSRSDTDLKHGEALEQWVKAKEGVATPEPVAAKPASKPSKDASRTLREILTNDLVTRFSISPDQLVLSFDPRDDAALNLSEGPFKFSVSPRRVRDLGEVSWDIMVVPASGGASRKELIRATARAWQEQVVAVRTMQRKQLILQDDVTKRRTLIDRLPDDAPLRTEQIVGQMAGRDIKPGAIMTAPMVEAVPLAKAGQYITVMLDRGNIRVKSVVKALEGVCYGQTIRVKNEATKDLFEVVLIGPQQASMSPIASPAGKPLAAAR